MTLYRYEIYDVNRKTGLLEWMGVRKHKDCRKLMAYGTDQVIPLPCPPLTAEEMQGAQFFFKALGNQIWGDAIGKHLHGLAYKISTIDSMQIERVIWEDEFQVLAILKENSAIN